VPRVIGVAASISVEPAWGALRAGGRGREPDGSPVFGGRPRGGARAAGTGGGSQKSWPTGIAGASSRDGNPSDSCAQCSSGEAVRSDIAASFCVFCSWKCQAAVKTTLADREHVPGAGFPIP
jgi:hypothetical protein